MTGYSRRPQDVDDVRGFLIQRAESGIDLDQLPTYGDVAAVYGGVARGVGPVLNSIARDCDQAGEPDLTALVVEAATRRPGTFAGKPVEAGSANEAAWLAELDAIARHDWGTPST